jgi:dolichyl-phosphate-mannose-protein mannosyltransferase
MARTRSRRRGARQNAPPPRPSASAEPRARRAAAVEREEWSRAKWIVAAAVSLFVLAIYILTAARDIFPGDDPEFIAVALSGGVAHPPGYPLLTMIGSLFGLLPVGPLPFRVSLESAFAHAATVGVVFLIGERLTRNTPAAAAGALVLAFGTLFWKWSLVAEAFPLNDLLVILTLYFLVVWHERPDTRGALFAAAVTFGLGVANHQTVTLLIPAFGIVVLDRRHELRGRSRVLAQAVGISIVAALVPYAYIPIAAARHEILNWGGVQSPFDLLRQFLRLDYGTGQLIPTAQYRGGTGIDRMVDFSKHANVVLFVLAALGLAWTWRHARWFLWVSVAAFVVTGPVFLTYANANIADATARLILVRFYLLPQVVVAPLAACGLALAGELVARRVTVPGRTLSYAVGAVAFAAAAAELVTSYAAVDKSGDHVAHTFAQDILDSTAPDTILLAGGDHIVLTLAYLQMVENARPDVTVIAVPLLPADWYQRELKIRHPELNVPLAHYEQPDGLKVLIDANPGRKFALTGEQTGQSFFGAYGAFGRGLILPVTAPDVLVTLESLREENDKLMASYHVPALASVDQESFEKFIVDWYALVPYRVGHQYEQANDFAQARTYFQKALAISPDLPEAIEGMSRIKGK